MNRLDLSRRVGALIHRLRYQRVRGLLWSCVQTAISPIGQLGLESLCQKDLTKPLTAVEAKIPITIETAGKADIDQISALAKGLWVGSDGSDDVGPYTLLVLVLGSTSV